MSEPTVTAGTKIFIADSLPANNIAADFDALPWIQIKGVRLAGELGNTWQTKETALIDVKYITRDKSNLMFATIPFEVYTLADDPGQALLRDASGIKKAYAFKVKRADEGIRYFTAEVISYVESQGGQENQIFDATASLEQKKPVVYV